MARDWKPLESILIKPSGPDCNLGCKYCFYLEKAELFNKTTTHRMSEEILENLVKQVMEQSGPNVSMAWQGGEPTLMGLDFYKKAIEFEIKYGQGKSVGNGFQTNGMLIDEEWARFFKEYNFLIGLSLDGPQHIHDHYRVTQNGRPSWERVMKSLKCLQNAGVEVNAMCCITDYSADYAEELYNFYKSVGLNHMQFIPVVETDKENPRKAADFSLTPEKYADFLCDLWDLWLDDFENGIPTTSIREFESLFHTYVDVPAPECVMKKECGIYVTVEHNGDIYSCDFFVEPKWKLGNIKNSRIIDMLNSKHQDDFGALKSKLPRKCKTCNWYKKCFGGCTKDRVKDKRDSGLPRFCNTTKIFLDYADDDFKELARQWRVRQEQQTQMPQQNQQEGDTYNAFGDFMGT